MNERVRESYHARSERAPPTLSEWENPRKRRYSLTSPSTKDDAILLRLIVKIVIVVVVLVVVVVVVSLNHEYFFSARVLPA